MTRLLAWLLGLYLGAIGLAALLGLNAVDLQTVAIVLSGCVVLWYTYETNLLRTLSSRQQELAIRPYVSLDPTSKHVTIENVGVGPALNVHIPTVRITEWPGVEPGKAWPLELAVPETVPLLRVGEKRQLPVESRLAGREFGGFFNAHIDPNYASVPVTLTVRYQNVEGKSYENSYEITPRQLRAGAIGPGS